MMIIHVKVIPLSKNPQIQIIQSGDYYSIKAYLKSPPSKGAANKELIDRLSKLFSITKNQLQIKKGLTSSSKILNIPLSIEELNFFTTEKDISLL